MIKGTKIVSTKTGSKIPQYRIAIYFSTSNTYLAWEVHFKNSQWLENLWKCRCTLPLLKDLLCNRTLHPNILLQVLKDKYNVRKYKITKRKYAENVFQKHRLPRSSTSWNTSNEESSKRYWFNMSKKWEISENAQPPYLLLQISLYNFVLTDKIQRPQTQARLLFCIRE